MPIRVSYPGVYVEEIPGGQPTTAGVSTASTAFIDFFARGPMKKAVRVTSMGDVNRIFGGLHLKSEASYGLKQYFLNGGQEAWVVRAGDDHEADLRFAVLDREVRALERREHRAGKRAAHGVGGHDDESVVDHGHEVVEQRDVEGAVEVRRPRHGKLIVLGTGNEPAELDREGGVETLVIGAVHVETSGREPGSR